MFRHSDQSNAFNFRVTGLVMGILNYKLTNVLFMQSDSGENVKN
jgi:hypothetical protein